MDHQQKLPPCSYGLLLTLNSHKLWYTLQYCQQFLVVEAVVGLWDMSHHQQEARSALHRHLELGREGLQS